MVFYYTTLNAVGSVMQESVCRDYNALPAWWMYSPGGQCIVSQDSFSCLKGPLRLLTRLEHIQGIAHRVLNGEGTAKWLILWLIHNLDIFGFQVLESGIGIIDIPPEFNTMHRSAITLLCHCENGPTARGLIKLDKAWRLTFYGQAQFLSVERHNLRNISYAQ